MAEEVVFEDILEQILLRLDVEDIIRCKKVCKSWYSLISSSTFVKSHLKHNNTGRRRILSRDIRENLLGSSNGLICILTIDHKLCVLNPCTRELKTLKNLDFNYHPHLCGFGYDPSSDDYKVIVVKQRESLTCFYLLSLKSNVWRVVGDFNFDLFFGSAGILCNGSLHWLVRDRNQNNIPVILSFHLSNEEFKEIPTPTDEKYNFSGLGIIEECLCIFDYRLRDHPKWVMKNYNDKQSWELLSLLPHLLQWDYDISYRVKALELHAYYRAKNFFSIDNRLSGTLKYIAPFYVQSLVSPHDKKRRKRKRKVVVGTNYPRPLRNKRTPARFLD